MSNPKVLVVDDEERFRLNMIRQLLSDGMDVEGAASGEEALEILGSKDFDVVILDIKMPGLSGVGVMKEISKRSIPVEVIFLTGHASVDDAIDGMKHGAMDYLLKPYPKDRLTPKVMAAYERRQKQPRPPGNESPGAFQRQTGGP